MKKINWLIGCLALLLLSSVLTACGGLRNGNSIQAKNLITGESVVIPLEVHNIADTGEFSNFTSTLDYNEMAEELRKKDNISDVTDINHYLRLETDNGEFYLKYNGRVDDEYRYSLFAEVGKANEFEEYVYVPFHMLSHYENSEYPAAATPFEGDVYYSNSRFSLDDFVSYYESKGIYTVEKAGKEKHMINLLITEKSSGYRFCLKAFENDGMFLLQPEHGEY